MPEFSELPTPPVCPDTGTEVTDCQCSCCEKIYEEYATIKVKRTCASTSPSDVVESDPSSGNPKDDNTFDRILDSIVVPTVGDNFLARVANSSIYQVGQWIQFISPVASYQIVAKDPVANTLTLRNSHSDGTTAISGNPAAGSTILENAPFIVSEAQSFKTDEASKIEFEAQFSLAEDLCPDSVTVSGSSDTLSLLALADKNGCDEEVKKCMVKTNDVMPKIKGDTFIFNVPDSIPNFDIVEDKYYLAAFNSTGELKFLDIFKGLTKGLCYSFCLSDEGVPVFEKTNKIWTLSAQEFLIGNDSSGTTDSEVKKTGTEFDLSIQSEVPKGATHARVIICIYCPTSGIFIKIKDEDDRIVHMMENSSGGGDDDHSNTMTALFPLKNPNNNTSITLKIQGRSSVTPWAAYDDQDVNLTVVLEGFEAPNVI